MRINNDLKLDFNDVLIRPKRSVLSSRKKVVLERNLKFKKVDKEWTGIPIIAANMDHVGTFEIAEKLNEFNMLTALHRFYSQNEFQDKIEHFKKTDPTLKFFKNIMVTTGMKESSYQSCREILKKFHEIDWICIDVANGYSETFVKFVAEVRKDYPKKIIVAGNVCTPEMTEQLIIAGTDVVKIGIGPGSVCTTRALTGVGYPQLSAVIECADAAHGLSGKIISDGGCAVPGDVSKAFSGGADFVMLGGLFAGHDECSGTVKDNKMVFYGMSSTVAMEKYTGGMQGYRAAEGKEVMVPYRGTVVDTVKKILGGLRSTCSYSGASELKYLPKCTTFVRVYRQLNECLSPTAV